jgi:hypothetical protein
MSTLQKVNLEPVSDILPLWRRDLPLAVPALADPLNAVALVDGEWVTLDSSYKWIRASDVATPGAAATLSSWPVFHERGRSDRMGMAEKKTTAIFRGEYEMDTRIFDAAADVTGGDPITTVLQPLMVATITMSGRNFTGLVGHAGSGSTAPIVGYVTKLPANNGGKLRFISGYRR